MGRESYGTRRENSGIGCRKKLWGERIMVLGGVR